MIGLEETWWRQEMSNCTRIDTVGVGDEQSGSKRCSEGGTQAIGTELTWGEQDMGSRARGHGGGGTQAVGLERTWRQEMSERLGLN